MAALFLFIGVSFKNDFFEIAKQIEIFTQLFKAVNQNYVDETNPSDLMDHAIKSMLKDLDPYTVFFNEQDVLKFKINNTGEYTGIGASVTRKDDKLIINEIYKNCAADKAGLKAGDQIIQIGDVVLKDFKDDASSLLKGAKNTPVELLFIRQNKTQKLTLLIDNVDIKAVPFYTLINGTTGYIVLSKFTDKASAETKEALLKLKSQGATRIILDVRGNPGGLLHEAVNICNLFVPKNEVIVTTKSKIEKHNNVYRTQNEPIDLEIPLVVLVDSRSASASEIVSGALQDLDRAVVMGSRSFGKGLVQRPVDLTYGTQLKITISRYYTPSGRCIQELDYSKKDKEGKPLKTDEKNVNAFKTKNGRTVYDGGGIMPDVAFDESKISEFTDALVAQSAIFNYATDYFYKHPTLKTETFALTEADFTDFKNYLKREKISIETQTKKALQKTLETAKKEKIDQTIIAQYNQLLAALEQAELKEVEAHKNEIKTLLTNEIIVRYAYKEGLYNYFIKNSTELQKATQLLTNTAEYKKILKRL